MRLADPHASTQLQVGDIFLPFWLEGELCDELVRNDLAEIAYSGRDAPLVPYTE